MILDEIVAKKKIKVQIRRNESAIDEVKNKALKIVERENEENYENSFKKTLKEKGLTIIGEFKKASPSKGMIVDNFNVDEILDFYNYMGIDAFSILTEEDYFSGGDEYLRYVKEKSAKPILRKDFIIDYYQIYETKLLGASGILLIAGVLKGYLGDFYEEAKRFNLQPLVEVHNKEELDLALRFNCDVIGINNRNLKTFDVSLDTTKNLLKRIPKDKIVVAESGIMSISDLEKINKYNVDGVLIGELFMKNIKDPQFKNEIKKFIDGEKM